MPCKSKVCKSKSTKVFWQCRHVVCTCTLSVQIGIQHSLFMSLTSRLFVCLLSFLFSFDCSVLTVYRRCCECTVSAVAAVTAVPMIILICFSIQLSISFARTFAIASVRHMARWLVGRCLLASQVACYVYYVHTALHTPCFVFHVRFWHSHVCDHDRVSYNSGEHTVTDVAATTTAQTIKPQTLPMVHTQHHRQQQHGECVAVQHWPKHALDINSMAPLFHRISSCL